MADYCPTLSPTFHRMVAACHQHPRYILSCGGTRSGKTFAALQLLYFLANKDKTPSVNSVVSETFPHLKRGAIRDFQSILGAAWRDDCWSKSESIYICPNSGSKIEFFSADSPDKVHGPARKRLFLNEIQNIGYDTARQMFIRTGGLIMLDYNPTHSFWGNELIEPKANCACVHSTYKDNPYLTAEQIEEIEGNKNDANWWKIYGLGQMGTLEGLIYDFQQIDAMPDPQGLVECYSLDFGFTHDPTVLLHHLIDTRRNIAYTDQCLYRRGMLNGDIAAAMKAQGIGRNVTVWADSSEPKTIADIASYGFNVKPCYKDGKKKGEQIQKLLGYTMKVTKRSVETIKEGRGYTWDKDKDGKMLNEPITINDHAMDALRYGIFNQVIRPYQKTSISRT